MKKARVYSGLITATLGMFTLISMSANAQKSGLSYEIGAHYVGYTTESEPTLYSNSEINASWSPYIGIHYRLQESELPLSIGLESQYV